VVALVAFRSDPADEATEDAHAEPAYAEPVYAEAA
jgi:hypothetical protein